MEAAPSTGCAYLFVQLRIAKVRERQRFNASAPVVRHIVCPPAFWFFMRPNVSSGSSPACVSVPSLTRCNRIVFMYSRSSAR